MKTLGPAILLLEAIVVGLAIPVAVVLYDGGARAAWVLGILAILLLVGSGYARRPRGIEVGSVLQLLVILAGVVVPALALLGLIFLGVWITAIVVGGKADRADALRAADARPSDSGPPPDPGV